MPTPKPVSIGDVAGRIVMIRGRKVLMDADVAFLYGVPTKRLNEQVRRNLGRFPEDFMFRLNDEEFEALRSQFATSSQGGRRYAPYAFTEHGALMAATVLNSARAVDLGIYVVRAFVQLRETFTQHKDLAAKLAELERKTEALALRQDTLATNTRTQLKQVFEAIRELMAPEQPTSRPIGFVTGESRKRR